MTEVGRGFASREHDMTNPISGAAVQAAHIHQAAQQPVKPKDSDHDGDVDKPGGDNDKGRDPLSTSVRVDTAA
jgi:hypothetical protein